MAPSAAITILLSRLYRLPSALPCPIISTGTVLTVIFTSPAKERPMSGPVACKHTPLMAVLASLISACHACCGAESTGKLLITKEP